MRRKGRLKVCIALTLKAWLLSLQFAEMILNVLSRYKFQVTLVRDGDRAALEADLLFLIGDCEFFDGYVHLLKHWKGKRPIIILWQLAPLPPPELSKHAEYISSLRSGKVFTLPSTWYLKLIKSAVPLRIRSKVGNAILSIISIKLKKQLKDISFQTFDEIDPTSRFVTMQGYMWIKRYFSEGWLDYVFVSSAPGAKFLNSMSIPAHFVPVGYHHGMGENQGMKRDIDVVFIGSTKNCRREGLLKTVCQGLKSNGMSIVIADHDCFGEQRTELLNRARISLNVVNHPWNLPGMRFLMSMGCGTLVISEPLGDPTPYKPGIHFVQTSISDLPEAVKYYIENDEKRETIVHSASRFITEKLTLENSISQIMKVCYEDSTLPPGYI